MPHLTGIALAANQDGRLELVAISGREGNPDLAGAVWHAWQKSPSGDWTGWDSLGQPGSGVSGNAPAVARNADGCLEAVVIADDGAVWHRAQTAPNGPGWSEWQSLERPGGQEAARTPVLAQDEDGSLKAFVVRQNDTTVWHASHQHETGWSGWDSLHKPSGGVSLEPHAVAVASNANGRLELFVTNSQAIWHRWQRQGGWSDWTPLGTPESPGMQIRPGVPVVARNGDGRLHLFTVASDGAVWLRSQHATQPGGWVIWQTMGRSWFKEAGAGVDGAGGLVLVTTSQENRLWQRGQFAPGGAFPPSWRDWSSFDTSSYDVPGPIDRPVLASNADGRLELFLLGTTTGTLYQRSQTPPTQEWPPPVWSDATEWPPPQ